MEKSIRDEYVDEHEVVRARLKEVLRTCRQRNFVLTPEMVVGVYLTVTSDCACLREIKPAEFDALLLFFATQTGYSKPQK